jgi:hypothetical protein
VHLVGFIIRIYHEARSSECQTELETFNFRNVRAVGNAMFNTKIFQFIFCLSSTKQTAVSVPKSFTSSYFRTEIRQDSCEARTKSLCTMFIVIVRGFKEIRSLLINTATKITISNLVVISKLRERILCMMTS